MRRLDQKRAELALLEAEEALREKKFAGTLTMEDRLVLRRLRVEYRTKHRPAVKDGAAPAPISGRISY